MKIFKIILLNIFCIALLILSVNALFLLKDNMINSEYPFRMYIPYENNLYYLLRDRKYLRKPVGLEYKDKKPVVLYGCSYSYGYLLDDNENFGAKLSEKTKRPVYNYSVSARGIQNMLYFLEKEEHYDDFEEPEYVIYTFIDDHVRRLYTPCNSNDNIEFIEYTLKNDKLVRKETPFKYLHSLYIYNRFQNFCYNKFVKNKKKTEEILIKYFEQSRDLFVKHYPNTKFVILLYPDVKDSYTYSPVWERLKNEGFIILNANEVAQVDLTKEEYKLDDKVHPNAQAWEKITDKLVNILR